MAIWRPAAALPAVHRLGDQAQALLAEAQLSSVVLDASSAYCGHLLESHQVSASPCH